MAVPGTRGRIQRPRLLPACAQYVSWRGCLYQVAHVVSGACRSGCGPHDGGRLSAIGWSWPSARFVAISCVVPFAYVAASYAVAWTLRGGFPSDEFLASTRSSFGWPSFPTWAVVSAYLVVNSVSRIMTDAATALGEEIGWRGFLSPALIERHGFGIGALTSGVIWSVWHFPLIFLRNLPVVATLVAAMTMAVYTAGRRKNLEAMSRRA